VRSAEAVPETVRKTTVEVPWRTILKVLAAAALVWVWLQIWQVALVLAVAVLLAVSLDPVVRWLMRLGVSRGLASTILTVTLLLAAAGFLWMTWAALRDQTQYLTQNAAAFEQQIAARLPDWARSSTDKGEVHSAVASWAARLGRSAVSALTVVVFGFVLTMYLLSDGPRIRKWIVAFVPERYRAKAERTLDEGRTVIYGYVAGNVIMSTIAFVVFLVALMALKVPAALLLALLTGLLDCVPVVGVVVSMVPAVLLAATVSPTAAIIVAALYIVYNLIETYVLTPWAYGGRLPVSDIAVILAFAVGAELAGVIGALIALPIAALYPAIERIWLRGELPDETIREHRALEQRRAG
jgi:predicted PurR-regulated permease PerM